MYRQIETDDVGRRDRPILFEKPNGGVLVRGCLVGCGFGRLKLDKLVRFSDGISEKPLLVERPHFLNK